MYVGLCTGLLIVVVQLKLAIKSSGDDINLTVSSETSVILETGIGFSVGVSDKVIWRRVGVAEVGPSVGPTNLLTRKY